MADFERDLFERCGDQRQRRDPRRMPVASNHLRRDCCGLQAEARADSLFGVGADVPECSHCARNFADAQILGGGFEARDAARQFVIPERDFQPERDRLGMDAVGAAHLRRVLEFERAALEDRAQLARAFHD